MNEKKYIGIDIGGTNIKIAIVNNSAQVLKRIDLKTNEYNTFEEFVDKTLSIIHNYNKHIYGIGIGAPSGNNKFGIINNAANLPWKGIINVLEIFKNKTNIPVAVANDANAAAIGEQVFGRAKGIENFAVVTIGTGVGSGIVMNNQLIEGFDGNGGEFGHIIIEKNGRLCGCGRKGCLETYTSATGILNTAKELFENSKWGIPTSSKEVAKMAIEGNEIAIKVFESVGIQLGMSIANMVSLLGLEKVILFGGPTQAGSLFLQPIQKTFRENVLHFYKNIKIEISALAADNAAILGAASLVMNVK